jgi:hypothetical protein
MRVFTLIAISTMSFAIAGPAFAQDSMTKEGTHPGAMAHMSAADTRRMHSCNAMSHERMVRSPTCRRMAQTHPEMMHHDSMMEHEGAMGHDDMMKPGQ